MNPGNAFEDRLVACPRPAVRRRHATGVRHERRLSRPTVGRRITPLARIRIDAGILVDALFGTFDVGASQIVPVLLPRRLIASIK